MPQKGNHLIGSQASYRPANTSSDALVTVIILNWNGRRFLEPCLLSLRRQTLMGVGVLIVDNGSTDGSVEFVGQRFPEVRVIHSDTNLGFAAGNNLAIRQARSDYVALLNNDTEADPRWIEELVSGLDRHPEISFCASKMLLYGDRECADACGDFYTMEGMAGKIGHRLPASQYTEPVEVFGACAGAAMYRRKMLEDVGLFDEDFYLIHEDTDLNVRARLLGHRCLFVPTAIVYHRLNATVGTLTNQAVYLGSRNIEYVYVKNMPASLVFKYGALHVVVGCLLFFRFLARGKGWPFLKGKLAVFAAFRQLLQKRGRIQGGRRVKDAEFESLLTRGWLQRGVRHWLQRRGAAPAS